ncbi:MAG: helix-turn-helix domain-containing protein [Clostridiaceae bacterium]|nr:helix-turn-helix domain-containing protein [Clostridiaceae bacterium]
MTQDMEQVKSTTYDMTQTDTCTGDNAQPIECSIEKALDVLGGKWTFLIIRDLFDGTRRFGELRKSLTGVSPKTLSIRLRELEDKDIVKRTAYATIPPTVEYSLTEKGRSLKPIIKAMKLWGKEWG